MSAKSLARGFNSFSLSLSSIPAVKSGSAHANPKAKVNIPLKQSRTIKISFILSPNDEDRQPASGDRSPVDF